MRAHAPRFGPERTRPAGGGVPGRPPRAAGLLGLALLLGLAACAEEGAAPAGDAPETVAAPEAERSLDTPGEDGRGAPNARPELHESLVEERSAPRHPSDGGGSLRLASGGEGLEAGGSGRFELVYEAGPEGVVEGGSLFLQVSPFWGWSTPQTREPRAPGFTEVTTAAEGVTFEARAVEASLLQATVAGRALRPGEEVRFVYGAGPAGARVDRFAEAEERLRLAVDGDGDGVRAFVADPPEIAIGPGPPARLTLHLPATARPGEEVLLRAALLDGHGSAGRALDWTLSLEAPEGVEVAAEAEVPAAQRGRTAVSLRATAPGVVRVRGRGPEGLEAESNPMLVREAGPRILFGDLHGHSNLSDGTGTPEDYYRYAREVAGLDVAALTDHDHWGLPFLDATPDHWRRIREAAAAFHEPGRFVTILGYEWTSWVYGHRHVLHFEEEAPLRSSVDPATDTPEKLWDALRGSPALTFAHHSAGDPVATDWSFPPDPELEPVTEVASVHGSSEAPDAPVPVRGGIPGNWVRDVLGRGTRLGFVGSGDSHDGHPGLAHLAAPSGGLAGILAEARTREAVLEALRARRTFATNGPRILLVARLDGALMGSVVAPRARHRLEVEVVAPSPLEAVELVVPGGVIERVPAGGRRQLAFETELEPEGEGPGALYVRALERDGGAAWSSPFFFAEEAPGPDASEPADRTGEEADTAAHGRDPPEPSRD